MSKKKLSLLKLLLIMIISMFSVLLAAPGRATSTYYVATNGSDSNPGTVSQPFATLAQAANKVAAGDIVYVRGGTYYLKSGVWIGRSGTSEAHIVFQSYPGETAILDGKNMPSNNDAFTIAGQYIDIKNFEVRNTTRIGINVWGGQHIQILNNIVHDSWRDGIYMGYSEENKVTDILVKGNIVYHNCLVNRARTASSGWPQGINSSGNGNIRVTNNKVYENYGEGIGFWGSGGLISGNTVYDNFSVEIYLSNATNATVERNLAYTKNNPEFYWNGRPASGLQVANEYGSYRLNNIKIVNNIVSGGNWAFYYGSYITGGGMKNFVIANNTFYGGTAGVINIDKDSGHSNTVFANNIFYQVNDPIKGVKKKLAQIFPSSGLTFKNNLWSGDTAGLAAVIKGIKDVMNADPRLVNPGNKVPKASDYKLQAGSPAIDAGSKVPEVTTDFEGTSRGDDNGYDIGAYEYVNDTFYDG